MINLIVITVIVSLFVISSACLVYIITRFFLKKSDYVFKVVFFIMTLILTILMIFMPVILKGDFL